MDHDKDRGSSSEAFSSNTVMEAPERPKPVREQIESMASETDPSSGPKTPEGWDPDEYRHRVKYGEDKPYQPVPPPNSERPPKQGPPKRPGQT